MVLTINSSLSAIGEYIREYNISSDIFFHKSFNSMNMRNIYLFAIKYRFISLLIISEIFLSGCTKFDLFENMNDPLPEVEMLSLEYYSNDTSIVTGRVVNEGASDVYWTGFCYNSEGNPEVMENQILLDGSKGGFSALVIGLVPDARYYFKAFAVNDQGYTISTEKEFIVPSLLPPEIPCTLSDNVISDNGINYNVENVYAADKLGIDDYYGIEATYGNHVLLLSFLGRPVNGIYTTSGYDIFTQNYPKKTFITVKSGMSEYYINPGFSVYVEELENGGLAVTFCNMTYTAYSSDWEVIGRIIAP